MSENSGSRKGKNAKDDLVVPIGHADAALAKTEQMIEEHIITRPNCKFCNHPARAKAETVWDNTHKYSEVLRFFDEYLEDNRDEDLPEMNAHNVRAHINGHYKPAMREIYMVQYRRRLAERLAERVGVSERCVSMMGALEMHFFDIASNPELCDHKKADSLVKLAKGVAELAKVKAEIDGEINDVKVIFMRFKDTWEGMIKKQGDETVRKVLMTGLDEFKGSMQEVVPKEEEPGVETEG